MERLNRYAASGVVAALLWVLAPFSLSSVRTGWQDARSTVDLWWSELDSQPVDHSAVETGTHWASASDFPTLHNLGYQFVITTVHPDDRPEWRKTFDAAKDAQLRLIVGIWPPPYSLREGVWTISPEGVAFLRYAASHASLVKGIFVYNEPYWVNPFTGKNDYCGAVSSAQLRDLRTTIRTVWPDARIFHDLGRPSTWAPGGPLYRDHPCLADRYTDSTGVADFVGIWFYPFDVGKYRKAYALDELRREVGFVRNQMQAQPIIAAQAYRCVRCGEATRLPTPAELKDWNCSVRALGPYGISWYPWRQDSYDDYLSNHKEMWAMTEAGACQ
jgi:hypothetical protein